tara:strand:+ start:57 stop:443 length:387 start_codon:yes stop_codon:yes gene_type:complete
MILILLLGAITPTSLLAESPDQANQSFCQQAKPVVEQLRTCLDLDSCQAACTSIADNYALRKVANHAAYKLTGAPLFEYCDIESLHTQKSYHTIADGIEAEQRSICNKKTRKKRSSSLMPKKILGTAH